LHNQKTRRIFVLTNRQSQPTKTGKQIMTQSIKTTFGIVTFPIVNENGSAIKATVWEKHGQCKIYFKALVYGTLETVAVGDFLTGKTKSELGSHGSFNVSYTREWATDPNGSSVSL
jgi:hypothetical protein